MFYRALFTILFLFLIFSLFGDDRSEAIPSHCDGFSPATIHASEKSSYWLSPLLYTEKSDASTDGVTLKDRSILSWSSIYSFNTQALGFSFSLIHTNRSHYEGPLGFNWSHSYNIGVVYDGVDEDNIHRGRLFTPTLDVYFIQSENGEHWTLPQGFFSTLTLDPEQQLWTLKHFAGLQMQFNLASQGKPGKLLNISEPNGNEMRLNYDQESRLTGIATDLGQIQTLNYEEGRITRITDHMGRVFRFVYEEGELKNVVLPVTEHLDLKALEMVHDEDFEEKLIDEERIISFTYDDNHNIKTFVDGRGETTKELSYDAQGRVETITLNGSNIEFNDTPQRNPRSLEPLEENNFFVRVTDREGNVIDYELHGSQGGPIDNKGPYGLRRIVEWTESGKTGNSNNALREGEPLNYQTIYQHENDYLAATKASHTFSSDDWGNLEFDEVNFPSNYPHKIYDYNHHGQTEKVECHDGRREKITYQWSYEEEKLSRLKSFTDPRFNSDPLYEDYEQEELTFIYSYDNQGNLLTFTPPSIQRGDGDSSVTSFSYNDHGQLLSVTDPNGNVTTYQYNRGSSVGGDMNTRGNFGGYLKSVTYGAQGSSDQEVNATSNFKVNSLGIPTQMTSAQGQVHDLYFNDLAELIEIQEPEVTLLNDHKQRYQSLFYYDSAGNSVFSRTTNTKNDGTSKPNAFIDLSQSFDVIGNLVKKRLEEDENAENDRLVTFSYTNNDQLKVVMLPEGNREFTFYDERNLPYKTFYGIEAPTNGEIDQHYPGDKRVTTLETRFVSFDRYDYDSQENLTTFKDGRGFLTSLFYDFSDRLKAISDPNGNGSYFEYDDGSNVITSASGSLLNGLPQEILERSYFRYDALGRNYQTVLDINLDTDESSNIDPDDGLNSSYKTIYDKSSRVSSQKDANGNPTRIVYDSLDRLIRVTDALGNKTKFTYDLHSNLIATKITEVDPLGQEEEEEFFLSSVYDELDRKIEDVVKGKDESLNHSTQFTYDSLNRLISAESPESKKILLSYNDQSELRSRTYLNSSNQQVALHEHAYDDNGNRILNRDSSEPENIADTIYEYDNLDRLETMTFADGTQRSYLYDANSNWTQETDERNIVTFRVYDDGNRLKEVTFSRQDGILLGQKRQEYGYDELNNLKESKNDFSQELRDYDSLSRLTSQTNRLNMQGEGFEEGYSYPTYQEYFYDRQSNQTGKTLSYGPINEPIQVLEEWRGFDSLNRFETVDAQFFDQPRQQVMSQSYFGKRVMGREYFNQNNEAIFTLELGYDNKHLINSYVYRKSSGELLSGTDRHLYDQDDNLYSLRDLTDGDRYKNYAYDGLNQLTEVQYRSGRSRDYREGDFPNSQDRFDYSGNLNRRDSTFKLNPFSESILEDNYEANEMNQYTSFTRDNRTFRPQYDEAGNMTRALSYPQSRSRVQDRPQARVNMIYGALNQPSYFSVKHENNYFEKQYVAAYNPFGMRVFLRSVSTSGIDRDDGDFEDYRWWLNWEDEEDEYVLTETLPWWPYPEEEEIGAYGVDGNLSGLMDKDGKIRAILIYAGLDDPLLYVEDGNGDGKLSEERRNSPLFQERKHFFVTDHRRSVVSILEGDSAEPLEYYRYSSFGSRTIYGLEDVDEDSLEDSPSDFRDNANQVPLRRSLHGVRLGYTSRSEDVVTGLKYYRHRYYEASLGRFLQKDPHPLTPYPNGLNTYAYVNNNPINFTDPQGWAMWVPDVRGRINDRWNYERYKSRSDPEFKSSPFFNRLGHWCGAIWNVIPDWLLNPTGHYSDERKERYVKTKLAWKKQIKSISRETPIPVAIGGLGSVGRFGWRIIRGLGKAVGVVGGTVAGVVSGLVVYIGGAAVVAVGKQIAKVGRRLKVKVFRIPPKFKDPELQEMIEGLSLKEAIASVRAAIKELKKQIESTDKILENLPGVHNPCISPPLS